MTSIIATSVVAFTAVILLLVLILLVAQAKLVQSGPVRIIVNGDEANPIVTSAGSTLLSTLSAQKIFLPSACGGGGTCAMCKCKINEGGGEVLPTEVGHLSRGEQKEKVRLSCQVKVKEDLKIEIPDEIFGIKKWKAKVVRNYNVASFIKEFVVEIPEEMNYEAGGYIQIEVPKVEVDFKNIDITAHPEEHEDPEKFKVEWDNFGLWDLKMKNDETIERAYSMASYPAEGREIMLNVRIATPPWDRSVNGWMNVNPGIASSYIFNLKEGDDVTISGPYGEFFINPSDAEMLYVGGGAGMAPLRSHLYHLFKTLESGRTVTFWYGGRSRRELFYLDHFKQLERKFPNFRFFVVLSEPLKEDNWTVKKNTDDREGDGFVGFVHQAVIKEYLDKHDSPEDLELYFCGPPLMNKAVQKMGEDFGLPDENIRFDDFGG